MRHLFRLMVVIALASLVITCASAVVINFDDIDAPTLFIDTTPLTELYALIGAHFSGPGTLDGGAILNKGVGPGGNGGFGVFAHSGLNFLAFNSEADVRMSNGGRPIGPETITFDTPAVNFSMYVAGGFDFYGPFTCTVNAYDVGGVLVGTSTVSGPTWSQVSLSWAAGIKSVLFQGGPDRCFVVDDVAFTTVPEPGSLLVLSTGLLGLFGALRLRRIEG